MTEIGITNEIPIKKMYVNEILQKTTLLAYFEILIIYLNKLAIKKKKNVIRDYVYYMSYT